MILKFSVIETDAANLNMVWTPYHVRKKPVEDRAFCIIPLFTTEMYSTCRIH